MRCAANQWPLPTRSKTFLTLNRRSSKGSTDPRGAAHADFIEQIAEHFVRGFFVAGVDEAQKNAAAPKICGGCSVEPDLLKPASARKRMSACEFFFLLRKVRRLRLVTLGIVSQQSGLVNRLKFGFAEGW